MAIIWRPDLSKGIPGDFTSFEIAPSVDRATRIAVVDAPGLPGVKAIRFHVKPGDLKENGARSELLLDDHRPEGTERFTAFSVYFPTGYPTLPKAWAVFQQFHQGYKGPDTIGQSPPVEFALNGEMLQVNINGPIAPYPARTLWSAPLVRDRWLNFILHARWSSKDGWVRVFLDGKEIVPKTSAITIFANPTLPNIGVYGKFGLYRNATNQSQPIITKEATIYEANILEASTLEDALSAAAGATPSVPVQPPVPPPPAPVVAPERWSHGLSAFRALYVDGKLVGLVDTPEFAAQIVAAMNAK